MDNITLIAIRDDESFAEYRKIFGGNISYDNVYPMSKRSHNCSDRFSLRNRHSTTSCSRTTSLTKSDGLFIGFIIKEINEDKNLSIKSVFPEYARVVKKFKGVVERDRVYGKNMLHNILLFKLLRSILTTKEGLEFIKLIDKLSNKIPIYKSLVFASIHIVHKYNESNAYLLSGWGPYYNSYIKNSWCHSIDRQKKGFGPLLQIRAFNKGLTNMYYYTINDFIKLTGKLRSPHLGSHVMEDRCFSSIQNIFPIRKNLTSLEAIKAMVEGDFNKANKLTKCSKVTFETPTT